MGNRAPRPKQRSPNPGGPWLTDAPWLSGMQSLGLFGGYPSGDLCLRRLREGTARRELPYGFSSGWEDRVEERGGPWGRPRKVGARLPREETVAGAGLTLRVTPQAQGFSIWRREAQYGRI